MSKSIKKSTTSSKKFTKSSKMKKIYDSDEEIDILSKKTNKTKNSKQTGDGNKTRTGKKNKNTDNDSNDSADDFENRFDKIITALKENYIEQKKLMNDMRELKSIHKKEIKLSIKSGNRSNSGKHTGFNKPEPVPSSLKKLLKIDEDLLPRSKITSLLYKYFTDNKMYNAKTKKQIVPNDKIKKIFGMKKEDTITFFNLQTWLKKVYNENSPDKIILTIDD